MVRVLNFESFLIKIDTFALFCYLSIAYVYFLKVLITGSSKVISL